MSTGAQLQARLRGEEALAHKDFPPPPLPPIHSATVPPQYMHKAMTYPPLPAPPPPVSDAFITIRVCAGILVCIVVGGLVLVAHWAATRPSRAYATERGLSPQDKSAFVRTAYLDHITVTAPETMAVGEDHQLVIGTVWKNQVVPATYGATIVATGKMAAVVYGDGDGQAMYALDELEAGEYNWVVTVDWQGRTHTAIATTTITT